MAYLGNKPVNNFVSFAKQDITGNGGTSYSLDYPVTGANDIDLYINNVRQEPTEAYSCSGSTLTLTEAVQSTDDIYAIFRGRALQTANHPSDSALEASQATISGNATISGTVTSGGNLKLRSTDAANITGHSSTYMEFRAGQTNGQNVSLAKMRGYSPGGWGGDLIFETKPANGQVNDTTVERMRVDQAGRVTMPYQPFMFLGRSNSYTTTNNVPLKFNITHHSRGLSWNTSTDSFTAPATGVYTFSIATRLQTGSLDYMYHRILTNGSFFPSSNVLILQKPNTSGGFQTVNTSVQVLLTQNDSISVSINYDGSGSHDVDNQSWMSVAFLG